MSNCIRQLRRNKLKQEIGSNKIREYYHSKYDTLDQRLKRGIKNTKNEKV